MASWVGKNGCPGCNPSPVVSAALVSASLPSTRTDPTTVRTFSVMSMCTAIGTCSLSAAPGTGCACGTAARGRTPAARRSPGSPTPLPSSAAAENGWPSRSLSTDARSTSGTAFVPVTSTRATRYCGPRDTRERDDEVVAVGTRAQTLPRHRDSPGRAGNRQSARWSPRAGPRRPIPSRAIGTSSSRRSPGSGSPVKRHPHPRSRRDRHRQRRRSPQPRRSEGRR